MLISYAKFAPGGVVTCGFYASLSKDLINWTEPQFLWPTVALNGVCPNQTVDELAGYPSIIDHDELDVNFENVNASGYLYYTRSNDGFGLDRDLVRRPITFTKN
jgi:hypothetical protein